MKNFNRVVKLKYGYIKLTFFKVYVYDCKSDERLRVIGKVFPTI